MNDKEKVLQNASKVEKLLKEENISFKVSYSKNSDSILFSFPKCSRITIEIQADGFIWHDLQTHIEAVENEIVTKFKNIGIS